jgi:hypothetical protein
VINVEAVGGRDFDVEVVQETAAGARGRTFAFRVTVDQPVLAALGLADDPVTLSALVSESFAFLLAREPADSILRRFDLSVISRYFPEYLDEMGASLAGGRGDPSR